MAGDPEASLRRVFPRWHRAREALHDLQLDWPGATEASQRLALWLSDGLLLTGGSRPRPVLAEILEPALRDYRRGVERNTDSPVRLRCFVARALDGCAANLGGVVLRSKVDEDELWTGIDERPLSEFVADHSPVELDVCHRKAPADHVRAACKRFFDPRLLQLVEDPSWPRAGS
jgi:hypothetical protein